MTKTTPDRSVEATGMPPAGRPGSRRLRVWGAVGAAVAVILGIWTVVARGESPPPTTVAADTTTTVPTTAEALPTTEGTPVTAPPPPTPEAVAREFIEAVGTDATVAFLLVASDAVFDAGGIEDIADLAAWLDWNVAIGWAQAFEGCAPNGEAIRCGFTYTNPWMEARGVSAGTDSSFSFVIEDGVIVSAIEDFNWADFEGTWIAFTGWLDRNRPGARQEMLTPEDKVILTPESIALWERYTIEFVEETVGNRFLDGFLSLDPAQLEAIAPKATDLHEEQYLQLWGAALGYQHTDSSCETTDDLLVCTLEGTDDLAVALDLTYVDRFEIRVASDGTIRQVEWDPASVPAGALDEYADWIGSAHPEFYEQGAVCDNFFGPGRSTPAACALAWLEAAPEYLQSG